MSALAAGTVAQKYPVFPCNPANKRPYISKAEGGNGFKDASRDVGQILLWWAAHPDALVGVPTGHASGVFIIDDDTANKPDAASSAWIERRRALLESTLNYATRSGGRHYAFVMPADIDLRSKQGLKVDGAELASIDTRGNGGYAVWWGAHGFAATGDMRPLPAELLADLTQAAALVPLPPSTPPGDWDPDEARKALAFIDAGKGYEKWCDIGMALHHASGGSDEGLALFDEWSQTAPDVYEGEDDCRAHWVSFKSKPGKVVKTIGTLYARAKENGYTPRPRTVDPSTIDWGSGEKPADMRPIVTAGTVPPVPVAMPVTAYTPKTIQFRHISDIVAEKREAEWLIHKVLERAVIAILAGPRGSFKSFIAHDWSMRIALAGHQVLILSGEGAGLDRRTDAWLKQHRPNEAVNLAALPMVALERPLSLSVAAELEALRSAVATLEKPPALTVIDTFSKFSAGLDENDNAQVAAFLSGISRALREEFKTTVLIVAHSGHSDPGRPRGASSLMANPDAEYIVSRPDPATLLVSVTRERFKDSPSLPALGYEGKVIDLGRKDRYGEAVTSLAFVSAVVPSSTKGRGPGANQIKGIAALGEWKRAHPTAKGMSKDDMDAMLTGQGINRHRRPEVIEFLIKTGVITTAMGGYAV